jgi:hypothetical protein
MKILVSPDGRIAKLEKQQEQLQADQDEQKDKNNRRWYYAVGACVAITWIIDNCAHLIPAFLK